MRTIAIWRRRSRASSISLVRRGRAAPALASAQQQEARDHHRHHYRENPINVVEREDCGLRLHRVVDHPERLVLPTYHLWQVVEGRRARHPRRALAELPGVEDREMLAQARLMDLLVVD